MEKRIVKAADSTKVAEAFVKKIEIFIRRGGDKSSPLIKRVRTIQAIDREEVVKK